MKIGKINGNGIRTLILSIWDKNNYTAQNSVRFVFGTSDP